MKRRIDRRYFVWGVAAIVLAAAFLLASARFSDAASEQVIDTAAPVTELAQCAPCHLNIGTVNEPGLVFSHGNHLLVSCDGCHDRLPHQSGNTDKVPMEQCFACHGVKHGPQGELATSECRACHTPSFDLRPSTHTKDWAKKPHVEASNRVGVNSCMMCHDAPKDCDKCHAKEAPGVPKMPNAYHSILYPRPAGPSIKMYPEGKVSMSQCVYCHPDLDAITPGRLIFAHADHLRRNYSCEACHQSFPHNENGAQRPDMLSCYRCHGLRHNGQGQVATEECDRCHPKKFNLKPANHTKAFVKGDHKKMADQQPEYCAMCHPSDFCVGCHRGLKVSPNAPGKPVIPTDHRKATWRTGHGSMYLAGDGACGSCHTDQSCKRCHKTVMPHPVGWIENHKPAPGIPASDCNVCHTDRSRCQKCHHNTVQRAELTAANCTPKPTGTGCHPEMQKKPATSIQQKSFAEHAVHFNVAKKKGKPYTCDDCHIGFGPASTTQNMGGSDLAAAGHDVRLCYGCHGSVDYLNRQIAPWPGAQLCIRCHNNMNL